MEPESPTDCQAKSMPKQLAIESDPMPDEVELIIIDFGSQPQTLHADGRQGLHLLINR